MKTSIPADIYQLLDVARYAPSVHNTQPWSFEITGRTVSIFIAKDRLLSVGDPSRRGLWVSLGAFVETLLLAAPTLGLRAILQNCQFDDLRAPIAHITVQSGQKTNAAMLQAIRQRHNYRRKLRQEPLENQLITKLANCTSDLPGVEVLITNNKSIIQLAAKLTYKGMLMALDHPNFRHELRLLLHDNNSSNAIGMPAYALGHHWLGLIKEKIALYLGFGMKAIAQRDTTRLQEANTIICIVTEGDVPSYWFAAGQAYTRLGMLITQDGAVYSTLAAAVEAGPLHEDLEQALGTKNRLQVLLRAGYAAESSHPTTPRLSVEQLLHST